MSKLSNEIFKNPVKLGPPVLENIAEIFKTLADPVRLALLQELKEGEKTVGELVKGTKISQPSLSKHLKILADAEVVVRRKEGVKVYYSLAGDLVFSLCRLVCGKLAEDQEKREMVDFSI